MPFCTDHEDGSYDYEERITIWQEADFDRAIERAEVEAREYASDLSGGARSRTEYLDFAQAYRLAGNIEHGAEVFSLIRASETEPDDYLDQFFDTGGEYQQSVASD